MHHSISCVLVCRVEACLPYCQRYGIRDAQGFLLERLGDIGAAVKLYTASLAEANRQLVAAVLGGKVVVPQVQQHAATGSAKRWANGIVMHVMCMLDHVLLSEYSLASNWCAEDVASCPTGFAGLCTCEAWDQECPHLGALVKKYVCSTQHAACSLLISHQGRYSWTSVSLKGYAPMLACNSSRLVLIANFWFNSVSLVRLYLAFMCT